MKLLQQLRTPHYAAMAAVPEHCTVPHTTAAAAARPLRYSAGIPRVLLAQRDILDQIVHFAFDTLGAQQLELHIRDGE